MTSNGTRWALFGVTTVTAVGVGRAVASRRRRHQPDRQDGWYVVHRSITIDRPVPAVIGFWTDRERMNRALAEWVTLTQIADDRWRCVGNEPAGGGTPWRAEITVEGSGRLRWVSTDGPPQEGTVELVPAPKDRGTELRVELRYRSGPLRRLAGLATSHEPDLALRDTLRRVKSLIECGQVLDTRRDPAGRTPAQEKATDKVREKLMAGGRA